MGFEAVALKGGLDAWRAAGGALEPLAAVGGAA
jgi:rhodanese-related sulfurtransferase